MVLSSENAEYFHLSAPLDEIIFDSKVSKSVFIVMFAVQISIEMGQTVANPTGIQNIADGTFCCIQKNLCLCHEFCQVHVVRYFVAYFLIVGTQT